MKHIPAKAISDSDMGLPLATLEPPPLWDKPRAKPPAPPPPSKAPASLLTRVGELERELDATRRELAHAHRLVTLGTLASSVAHEQNNLLTPVISYAQLALESPTNSDLMLKAVEKAMEGAQAASDVSASLLGFAAGRGGDPKDGGKGGTADLKTIVQASLQCLPRDPAKDGIKLTVDIPEATLSMPGLHLQQILVNLVLNAKKAMGPTGGKLTIRGNVTREEAEGRWLDLVVADTGPGIAESIRDRLIEPFVTKPIERDEAGKDGRGVMEEKGTGLGLSICRDLIQRAGGRLGFETATGEGTQFVLALPIVH